MCRLSRVSQGIEAREPGYQLQYRDVYALLRITFSGIRYAKHITPVQKSHPTGAAFWFALSSNLPPTHNHPATNGYLHHTYV